VTCCAGLCLFSLESEGFNTATNFWVRWGLVHHFSMEDVEAEGMHIID
jgi:hypothetical protein